MTIQGVIDKIKKVFSSESDIIKLNNIQDNKVKFSFLKNAKIINVENVNNTYNINIDIDKATNQQITELKETYPILRENGYLFLKNQDFSIVKSYLNEYKDTSILKYFIDKIEYADYQALRTSVFIKKKYDSEEDIEKYLSELSAKFGSRGKNICNLYCENYFDTFIKPYYALLESENRTIEFKKGFDDFVTQLPITYFVSRPKTKEQIKQELNEKIEKSKKYGIKKLNIHGIGKENKEKIIAFLEDINGRNDLKVISRNEIGDRISVTLEIYTETNITTYPSQ